MIVLTLDDLRKQVNVAGSQDDELLQALEASAVRTIERHTGRSIRTMTYNERIGELKAQMVLYEEAMGETDDGDLVASYERSLESLRGEVLACEEQRDEVCEDVKHAIRILVTHWFDNRDGVPAGGSVGELPYAVSMLLSCWVRMR